MKCSHRVEIICLAGIVLVSSFLAVSVIRQKSVGFDEAQYPAAGYAIWKNADYSINAENPPLAKLLVSLPLIFLRLDIPKVAEMPQDHPHYHFVFGHAFLAENTLSQEKILLMSRIVVVILSIACGVTIFLFTRKLFGMYSALISALLYFFCPNILAYSSMATTDLITAFLTFLFVVQFSMSLRAGGAALPSLKQVCISGLILGLALLTKHTAFVLLPVAAALTLLHYLTEEKLQGTRVQLYDRLAVMLLTSFAVVLLGYRVIHIKEYFSGLATALPMALTGRGSGGVYLAGAYSTGGWWYYYLAVFLLKTPLSVIALMVSALISIYRRRTLVRYPVLLYILSAALVIFISLSMSTYQVGMRALLPVYPLLFVWLSEEAVWLWNAKRSGRVFVAVLGGWYMVSAVTIHPHHLAYFNELIGGPKRGYSYLADCNIDWGQDLKGLKDYLADEGDPPIILSYFGNDAPSHYGIRYQEFAFRSRIPVKGEPIELSRERQLLAVSATNLTGVYYPQQEDFFNWLEELKPIKRIGYSILVYDITNSATAYEKMGTLYKSQNRTIEAERAFSRMKELGAVSQK